MKGRFGGRQARMGFFDRKRRRENEDTVSVTPDDMHALRRPAGRPVTELVDLARPSVV